MTLPTAITLAIAYISHHAPERSVILFHLPAPRAGRIGSEFSFHVQHEFLITATLSVNEGGSVVYTALTVESKKVFTIMLQIRQALLSCFSIPESFFH